MDEWIAYGADRIDEMTRQDPVYQQMLAQHQPLAEKFDNLMESLSFEHRELILEYLNLALDMEARKTRTAWYHRHK